MNRLKLIEILSSVDEEDVWIEDKEGHLFDIDIDKTEQMFDGFVTVYPASVILRCAKEAYE
jgi:hypothetical protein